MRLDDPALDSMASETRDVLLLEAFRRRLTTTVLSGMDAELAALEVDRNKTRALKKGMMQELLSGRIQLV